MFVGLELDKTILYGSNETGKTSEHHEVIITTKREFSIQFISGDINYTMYRRKMGIKQFPWTEIISQYMQAAQ